jgi:hypothetical protein
LENKDKEVSRLQEQFTKAEAELATFQGKGEGAAALQSTVDNLQEAVKKAETKFRAEIAELQHNLEGAQKDATTATKTLVSKSAIVKTLKSKLETMSAKSESQEAIITELRGGDERLKQELATTRGNVTTAASSMTESECVPSICLGLFFYACVMSERVCVMESAGLPFIQCITGKGFLGEGVCFCGTDQLHSAQRRTITTTHSTLQANKRFFESEA